MYLNGVGGAFQKAQTQNGYEKARCDLHKEDIAKEHFRSLYTINKSIKDAHTTLKYIKASSGYYKPEHSQSNRFPVAQTEQRIVQMLDISEQTTQLQQCSEIQEMKITLISKKGNSKIQHQTDSKITAKYPAASSISPMSNKVDETLLFAGLTKDQENMNEPEHLLNVGSRSATEFSNDGKENIRRNKKKEDRLYKSLEINMKSNSGTAKAWLPGENNLIQAQKRNLNGFKEKKQHSTVIAWDPAVNEIKSNLKGLQVTNMEDKLRSDFFASEKSHNMEDNINSSNTKFTETQHQQSAGQLPKINDKLVRQDNEHKDFNQDPKRGIQGEIECDQGISILKKPTNNSFKIKTYNDVTMQVVTSKTDKDKMRNQSAQFNLSVSNPRIKSAPTVIYKSDDQDMDVNWPRNDSAKGKIKIHVALSKRERKKILQELISNCNSCFDRTILEKERQRLLQHKISTFLASIIEKCDEDLIATQCDN